MANNGMWLNTTMGVSLDRPRDVLLDEVELIGAQMATAQRREAQRVDQRDEVHAGDVEAVPAVAAGAGAERLAILLARVVGRVVFTGHREDVRRVETRQHLLDLIELPGVERCVRSPVWMTKSGV